MSVKVALIRTNADGSKTYGLRINHKGKRRTISVGTEAAAKKTKPIAEIELAKGRLGVLKKTTAPTFKAVGENYLLFAHVSRSKKTFTRYKGLLHNYIYRHLGSKPVDQVTRGDIRDMLTKIYKGGASKSSIELMHTVCSNVFEHAIDDELISSKPTAYILKKLELKRDKKDINPFTADQIRQLLAAVPPQYQLFFRMAFATGARVGELCALEWSHINLTEQEIKICQTADAQVIKESTKTYLVRDVDMSDSLRVDLMEHKKQDKKECFRVGIPQRFVFHHAGRLFSQNTLLRNVQRACAKLGIGHHTVHDIRHTTASLLLAKGAPLPYVSKLLGHSSPKITLDVYSHYMPSENKGLVNMLDEHQIVHYKGAR